MSEDKQLEQEELEEKKEEQEIAGEEVETLQTEEGTEEVSSEESRPLTKEEVKAAKKKAKAEKKDKAKEKIEELEDRVKRQMAEFDNFRKRTEKEKSQMFEIGVKSVIEKILPVVDNFERGLQTAAPEGEAAAFMEGMNMVYKQLMTELEGIGVKAIEAIGTEFNPEFHNAVMQVESEEYESGIVAQELQKGYMYHDTVVRHSMVAVVQ
ncbi:MAG: nucleotide exchange factor GrpE [Lachnospiraceae bacterium]|nr:nucleotide exchange factor GrpE [Lachnospiraceae bacterium]